MEKMPSPFMSLLLFLCATMVSQSSTVEALIESSLLGSAVDDIKDVCIVRQSNTVLLQEAIDNCRLSTVVVIGASHSPQHSIGCLVISNRTNLRVIFQHIFHFSPLLCPSTPQSEFLRIVYSVNVSIVGLNLVTHPSSTSLSPTLSIINSDRIVVERLTLKVSIHVERVSANSLLYNPVGHTRHNAVVVCDLCSTVTVTHCDITVTQEGVGAPPRVDMVQVLRSVGITIESCIFVMPLRVGRIVQLTDTANLRLSGSQFLSTLHPATEGSKAPGSLGVMTTISFASLCALRIEGSSSEITVVDNRFEVRCVAPSEESAADVVCSQRILLEYIQVRALDAVSRLVVRDSVFSVAREFNAMAQDFEDDIGTVSVVNFISVKSKVLHCSLVDNLNVSGLSGIQSAAVVLDVNAVSNSVVRRINVYDASGANLDVPFIIRSRVAVSSWINQSVCGTYPESTIPHPRFDGSLRSADTTPPAEGCPPAPSGTVSALTAGLLCGGSAAVVAIGFLTGICIKVKVCQKPSSSIEIESGADDSNASGPLLGDAAKSPPGSEHNLPDSAAPSPEETAPRDEGAAEDPSPIDNDANDDDGAKKKEMFVAMPQGGHWGARAERGVGTLWKWGQAAVRSRSHSNSASTISCGSSDSPRFVRAQYQPPSVLRGTADDCPFPHPGNHAAGSMSRRVNSCSIHSSEFSTSTEASLNNSTGSLN